MTQPTHRRPVLRFRRIAVPLGGAVLAALLAACISSGPDTMQPTGAEIDQQPISRRSADSYTVAGTVSGLAPGAKIVLLNSGGDALTVGANGKFVFPRSVPAGGLYAVTLGRQAIGQSCAVSNGYGNGYDSRRGWFSVGDVTDVVVDCGAPELRTVHSFGSGPEGSAPAGNLVQAVDGVFYGATASGGHHGQGALYRMTAAGRTEILRDSDMAMGELIQAGDGSLYGTMFRGGATGAGTVFRINRAGLLTVLHDFNGSEGAQPSAGLALGSDGSLYGTSLTGGIQGKGTVFKITPSGSFTLLHEFSGDDGAFPSFALTPGSDGDLYGQTSTGGALDRGALFKVSSSGVFTLLHSFTGGDSDGSRPSGALVRDSDGNLYGSTQRGGIGDGGVLFRLTPAGTLSLMHAFGSGGLQHPVGTMVLGSDGNLYGAAADGGDNELGGLFRIALNTRDPSVLASFRSAGRPVGGVMLSRDGSLYGITDDGGSNGRGSVYRFGS